MSVMISKPFRSDENAEWHRVEDCECIGDDSRVVCMVCGEDIKKDKFFAGIKVTCPDCGIYLEVVTRIHEDDVEHETGHLVHFVDSKNANCADEFYKRLQNV